MLLSTPKAAVLIDCGMFQGSKTLKALNYGAFPFDLSRVDALLVTHAHVDHTGLIPKLARAGFTKPIYATPATIALCGVLLPDAGAIQEMEVEALNRRNQRHGQKEVSPIYTKADAEQSLRLFVATPLGDWIDVAPGMRARWWNAGHILGAASIEIEVEGAGPSQRLLFSGDVGPGGRLFESDPEGPAGVDHVILESTYGDVERPALSRAERKSVFAAEIMAAHTAGGPLLIPAFAVERTQELIVDLLELIEANQAPPGPIFIDSPLAVRACDVFLRHGAVDGDAKTFSKLRESGWLKFTEGVDESRAIERVHGWHVIIAGSGMCDAGRVRHHLKRQLWRSEATVLLVGFQAPGTLGRFLQEGKTAVRIQGDEIRVAARVRNLAAYSGHADAQGLVRWVQARAPISGGVLLTHGEPENASGLRRRLIASNAAGAVIVAALDQMYELSPGALAVAEAPQAPRLNPAAVASFDWHNARSEFLAQLQQHLDAAPDDAARERLLARLCEGLEAP